MSKAESDTGAHTKERTSPNTIFTGAILAASLLVATYGGLRGNANDESRLRTLTADATAKIPGFEAVVGNVPATSIFTDIGNVAIELEDGSVCDVQYTDFGEGLQGSIFPDQARIVSYGTCPQPAELVLAELPR